MKNRLKTTMLIGLCFLLAASALGQERITYFHNDALGSPIAATDADGDLLWTESYSPYGERLERSESTDEHSAFYTGKPHDDTTGLTYMGARDYDPVLGRFLGMDPVGFDETNVQSFNKYAYGNNNPYRFTDPDGRKVFDESGDPNIAAALKRTMNHPVTAEIYRDADAHDRKIIFKRFSDAPQIAKNRVDPGNPAVTEAGHRENMLNEQGTGSTVYLDPTANFLVDVGPNGFKEGSPIELVIAHELFHALENAKGINRGRDSMHGIFGVSLPELRARRFENTLRRRWNKQEKDESKHVRPRTTPAGRRFR